MLKGFLDIGPEHFGAAVSPLWLWMGTNALELSLVIFFAQGLCTLWLSLYARSLSRQLRRAMRTSEQYAALTQAVGRTVADLSTRLDAVEFAIKTYGDKDTLSGDRLVELIRSEIAQAAAPDHAGKSKPMRTSAKAARSVSELGGASAD